MNKDEYDVSIARIHWSNPFSIEYFVEQLERYLKINKIKTGIMDLSKQQVITYLIFALIITFSTLNTYWAFEVNRKYKRTVVCDKKPSEETINKEKNKYNIKEPVFPDPIITLKY